ALSPPLVPYTTLFRSLARALWMMGARVDIVLFGRVEESKGDARTNFEIIRHLASFNAGSSDRPPPLSFAECHDISAWERIARCRSEEHTSELQSHLNL